MNPDQQLFGEKRLEHIIQNSEYNSAEELKDTIFDNINQFKKGNQQNDDITFVVLKAK